MTGRGQHPMSVASLVSERAVARYDTIGHGYAKTRREDPRFCELIRAALGDARTVVNVGAGAGAYEPTDRYVIAIERSAVMIAQRSRERAPAVLASAGCLPLRDRSVDAAMSVLSLHHWDDEREQGVRELRRVSRGPVVILTYDAAVSSAMWLMADYLPEVAELDARIFAPPEQIAAWLGGDVRIEPVPISRDTPDWMLGSFWAHPERVLDANARAATSGFARMAPQVVERVVAEVSRDLANGDWDRKHGHLRSLDALDVGLRLVIA
jgi:SAM-dependent methyltransferase